MFPLETLSLSIALGSNPLFRANHNQNELNWVCAHRSYHSLASHWTASFSFVVDIAFIRKLTKTIHWRMMPRAFAKTLFGCCYCCFLYHQKNFNKWLCKNICIWFWFLFDLLVLWTNPDDCFNELNNKNSKQEISSKDSPLNT